MSTPEHPPQQVSSVQVEPATRQRPGSVAIDLGRGDRKMDRNESTPGVHHAPQRGEAS